MNGLELGGLPSSPIELEPLIGLFGTLLAWKRELERKGEWVTQEEVEKDENKMHHRQPSFEP